MSTKVRALLWEELRVGGSIAGLCALFGLATQFSLRFFFNGLWQHVQSEILTVTLGLPLLIALLLIQNTANTGHLSGGFSKRILRLPVKTESTVLIVLWLRFAMVLVIASLLFRACWFLYGNGPDLRVVFLLAGAYLLIQMLDWARQVAASLVTIAVLLGIAIVLVLAGSGIDWKNTMFATGGVTVAFPLCFAGFGGVVSVIAVMLVRKTRCGEQLPLSNLFTKSTFDNLVSVPVLYRRKPFASPLAAQTWFELRRDGLFFPATLIVVWLLSNAARWLVEYSSFLGSSHSRGEGFSSLDPQWTLLDPLWTFEILPLVALVLAAAAWNLRAGRSEGPAKGRPATFARRQPITGAQMAHARLIANGINLCAAMAVLVAVYTSSVLLSDNGLVAGIMAKALAQGETGPREIAAYLLGPPLLALMLAWVIMGLGRPFRGFVAAVVFLFGGGAAILVWLLIATEEHALKSWMAVVLLWLLMLSPSLLLASRMTRGARTELVPKRAILVGTAAWATLTIGIYPFSSATYGQAWPLVSVLVATSLGLGALLVMPYFGAVLALSRRGKPGPLIAENPDQHGRAHGDGNPGFRTAGVAGLLALLVMLAWLRWPAEASWKALWRAQGLPTNRAELDAWYEHVEPEQNLAMRYIDASDKAEGLELDWSEALYPEAPPLKEAGGLVNAAAARDRTLLAAAVGSNRYLAIVGGAEIERSEPISPVVWEWTKRYYDEVASAVCRDLHAAARAGLTRSRYPADLTLDPHVILDHLAKLRQLARLLAVEAWVAAVEQRPAAAIDAILDIAPVAESLKYEPYFISQFVRVAVHGISLGALENAMNRITFSQEELERIQEGLAQARPDKRWLEFFHRAMIGEQVYCLTNTNIDSYFAHHLGSAYYDISSSWMDDLLLERTAANIWAPVIDIYARDKFEALVILHNFAEVRPRSLELIQRVNPFNLAIAEDAWRWRLEERAPRASSITSGITRIYPAAWKLQTQFGIARTAVAVERFRLAHGRLPLDLEALVPAFLSNIPQDMWNHDRSLSYRIKDNGEFVVYSYGWDGDDDRGEEEPDHEGWLNDITFSVAPVERRGVPQVAGG